MVEQEGHGVAQDLAQQSACQVPQVACPYALYRVALCELRKDSVDTVAKPAQEGAPLGIGIAFLGPVGSSQLDAPPGQLLPNWRRPVVAVPDHHVPGMLNQLGHYRKLVDVGWGYRDASDHPRPAHPHVHPKAIEGLLEESVLAKGSLSFKTPATVGAGKQACRQGHRVADGEASIVRGFGQELLPEVLLDLPEVGCLSRSEEHT